MSVIVHGTLTAYTRDRCRKTCRAMTDKEGKERRRLEEGKGGAVVAWSREGIEGTTGLHREFRIAVRSSRAKTPEKYDRPVWVLEGEMTLPDGTKTDGDLRLSFGQKWEPGDAEGTFLLHNTGKVVKLNENTGAMKFIKTGTVIPELLAVLESRSREHNGENLESCDLLIWEGLVLDIDHVKEMRTNPQTGVEKEAEQAVIVGFGGTVDGTVPPASGAGSSTTGGQNGAASGVSDDDIEAIAKSSDSYIKFLESVTGQGVDPGDARVSNAAYQTARA